MADFLIRALIIGVVFALLGGGLSMYLRWYRSRSHPILLKVTGGWLGRGPQRQGSGPQQLVCPNDGGSMVRVMVNQGQPDQHVEFECQSCNTAYNPATGETFTF